MTILNFCILKEEKQFNYNQKFSSYDVLKGVLMHCKNPIFSNFYASFEHKNQSN